MSIHFGRTNRLHFLLVLGNDGIISARPIRIEPLENGMQKIGDYANHGVMDQGGSNSVSWTATWQQKHSVFVQYRNRFHNKG